MSLNSSDFQELIPIFIIIIGIAILVAVFFSSKRKYKRKNEVNIRYGKMHFFYVGRVRQRKYKLIHTNLDVWAEHQGVKNVDKAAYFKLKKEYSFSQRELRYLNDPQIEELTKCLIRYSDTVFDAVYNGKNIKEFTRIKNELKRFKVLIKKRQIKNDTQKNYLLMNRDSQLIALKKKYSLNKQNLKTLSSKEETDLNDCIDAYLHLLKTVDFNPNSVVVLDSLKTKMADTKKDMLDRVNITRQITDSIHS